MTLSFRVFGFPVSVQPWFWLLTFLIGPGLFEDAGEGHAWLPRLGTWVAIVFTGVLAHELGHAFAGRAFGLTPRIVLHGLGGLTSWDSGRQLTPVRSIVVSVAGPGVGIIVGTLAYGVGMVHGPSQGSLLDFALDELVFVNLGWGLLNLLPMQPLDGGNVMASFFELVFGDRARVLARWASLGVAALIVGVALLFHQTFAAVLVAWLAFTNLRALRVEREVGPDRALLVDLLKAQQLLKAGDAIGAERRARSIADRAKGDAVRGEALSLCAFAELVAGNPAGAMRALEEMPASRPADPTLRGSVLLAVGDTDAAVTVLAEAMRTSRGPFLEERFVDAVLESGRFDVAIEILDGPRGRSAESATLEKLEEGAYRAAEYEDAAVFGQVLWEIDRRPTRAYNVACALTRSGDTDKGMEWLKRAQKAGFDRVDMIDADDDLAPLRARPDWQGFRRAFDA